MGGAVGNSSGFGGQQQQSFGMGGGMGGQQQQPSIIGSEYTTTVADRRGGGMGGQQQSSGVGMENFVSPARGGGFGNPYAGPMGGYGGQMGNPYAGQMGGYGPQMGYGGGMPPPAQPSGQMGFLQNMLQGQPQQPQQPQQPAWQQSDEWKGYQTQMSDLQNQLNQSPIMQQLQALQGKMQGYQQQYQPQAFQHQPLHNPYMQQQQQQQQMGQMGGIASLFGGMGLGMGQRPNQGMSQNTMQSAPPGMEMRKGHGGTYFVPKGTPYNPGMG